MQANRKRLDDQRMRLRSHERTTSRRDTHGRTRRKKPQLDQVDRAIVAVERAIGRLVALLGDDDPAVMERAALTLAEIGPFAVGPLAAALPRAASSRHRAIIIGALLTFGRQAKVPVMDALIGELKRESDPHVKVAAQGRRSTSCSRGALLHG